MCDMDRDSSLRDSSRCSVLSICPATSSACHQYAYLHLTSLRMHVCVCVCVCACTCVFTRTHTHKEPYHRPLRRPINTHPRTHDTCTQRHTHWRNRIRGLSARHKQHVAKEDRLPPFRCVYACYSISNVHVCTPPQEIVCPDNARPLSLFLSLRLAVG
jgi:hypothetical protein